MTDADPTMIRCEIMALYGRYARLLDEGPRDQWPELFDDTAVYKIVTRENVKQGWPIAMMLCEGRAALEDRIYAAEHLSMTIPRQVRHLISCLDIDAARCGDWACTANFAAFESLPGHLTRVFATGLSQDVVGRGADGRLRFRERTVICDGAIVDNSLIVPL